MKSLPTIPHKQRLDAHRVEYLRAINESLDYPWQSEDGREPSPHHQELEALCKKYHPLTHWQFTDCCTDSLQVAFHAFCNPGDTVIVPAYGWRAISNAPQFVGLNVLYCDMDDTGNVDLNILEEMIKEHLPKTVLIVHNFGTVVDVAQIKPVCDEFGVFIIEDAAPTFTMGEPYEYKIGSESHATCFSFDFTKSPGTLGSGGAIATNYTTHAFKFKSILAHISTNLFAGTKSYLDTTSAAVLCCDIKLIEQHNYRRQKVEVATFYLNNIDYKTLSGKNYIFHRFIILPDKDLKISIINKLKSQKILAKSVYKPNTDTCYRANEFYASAIELPCHQFIDIDDLKNRFEKLELPCEY